MTTTIVALGLRRGISLAAGLVGVGGVSLVAGMALVTMPGDARSVAAAGAPALVVLALVVLATLALVLRLRAGVTGEVPHDLARVRRAAKLVTVALALVAWTSLAVACAAMRGGAE